ncbi:MAG TPA: hypothetical protein VNZ52_15785 [Candidatus Thermoplasmatota archaeon]|nr:hypothetical protein [Candidatus Thermoplasmatota archaeon]
MPREDRGEQVESQEKTVGNESPKQTAAVDEAVEVADLSYTQEDPPGQASSGKTRNKV